MHNEPAHRPIEGPPLPTPDEHDAMHGGRGEATRPQGAHYVMNRDRPGRLRCFPCGLPVQIDQEGATP